MATATIQIEGIDALLKKLDPKRYDKVLHTAMSGAVDMVRAEYRGAYPPPPTPDGWVAKMPVKQRRGFFAKLRTGEIEVPYRRGQSPGSEKLGASWTRKIRRTAQGLEGIIGTRVSYARWVMDKGRQAPIHAGRWPTVQDLLEKQKGNVRRIFEQAIRRAIA